MNLTNCSLTNSFVLIFQQASWKECFHAAHAMTGALGKFMADATKKLLNNRIWSVIIWGASGIREARSQGAAVVVA
jgi:hypothetical protein